MSVTLKKDSWKIKDGNGTYRDSAIFSTTLPEDAAAIVAEATSAIDAQQIRATGIVNTATSEIDTIVARVNDLVDTGTDTTLTQAGAAADAKAAGDKIGEVKSALESYVQAETEDISVTSKLNVSGKAISSSTGKEYDDSNYTTSQYIYVPKGWTIAYSGLRAGSSMNIVSFYNSESFEGYDASSTISGQGAGTPVSGTYTATENKYVRFTTRTANLSGTSLVLSSALKSLVTDIQDDAAYIDNTFSNTGSDIKAKMTRSGALSTSTGGVVTDDNFVRTDYIYVPEGYFVKYENLRGGTSNALLCYYSDRKISTFDSTSVIVGAGTSNPLSGFFKVTANGYVRLSTRASNISEVKVTLVAPFSSGNYIVKYVSATGNNDNSGDAPSNAYATIAKALSVGASEIRLATGTYTESVYAVGVNVKIVGNGSLFTVISPNVIEFRNSIVELENIDIDMTGATGSASGVFVKDCYAKITHCSVSNAPYMGFRFDGSYAVVTECVADTAATDGFNGHDTANNITEAFFINCVAKNCGDDGLSFHEEGIIHVLGGEYFGNTNTGIAPHNNCNCDIREAYVHSNGRAGIEALVGQYTIPDPLPTMVLSGCIFENNTGNAVTAEHYIVKACGNGASGNGTNSIVDGGGSTVTTFALMS